MRDSSCCSSSGISILGSRSRSEYIASFISSLGLCVLMKGIYVVANNETRDAASTPDIAFCSPERKQRMIGVAREVRVIPTFIAAAKERHARGIGIPGKTQQRALPKAAPEAKNGKMKPPRYPPDTVNEIATSFAIATIIAW